MKVLGDGNLVRTLINVLIFFIIIIHLFKVRQISRLLGPGAFFRALPAPESVLSLQTLSIFRK